MQIVRIPWAHIPVSVELDIPGTDKLAMVRNKQTNKQTNNFFLSPQLKKLDINTFDVDAKGNDTQFIFNNYELCPAEMG